MPLEFDPEVFGEAMADLINEAVKPLHEEIAQLKRQLESAPDVNALVKSAVDAAQPSKSQRDAELEGLRAFVVEQVRAIPPAKNGTSPTTEEIDRLVAKEVAKLPPAEPGKSVTLADVQPILDEATSALRAKAEEAVNRLDSAVAGLRQPKDGDSVTLKDVEPTIREAVQQIRADAMDRVEAAIKAIPEPKSGVGMAGAFIDRDGVLQLTLTNGEVKGLGVVVGKDGADFTDTTFEYDGERGLIIRGKGGEITKRLPIPMDRGYYRDGMPPIEKGDVVTHDGNAWIALRNTKERPSHEAKDDWRLMVRKGRDGESVIRKVPSGPELPIKLKD